MPAELISEFEQLEMDNSHLPLYRAHGCSNIYSLAQGVFALPVAEDPPGEDEVDENDELLLDSWSPVVIVHAHAPYRVRTVSFESEKQGAPPLIPKPISAGAFEFLEGVINFLPPKLNSDCRTFTWGVSGGYTFVENVRSHPNDGFVLTSLPANTILQAEALEEFGNNIDNPNSPESPQFGAISQAGDDAKLGYAEAQRNLDLASGDYGYNNPAYFPYQMLHDGLINGTVTFVTELQGSNFVNSSLLQ